jgi:prepilin-type N-terminal cleavage/methylation domain-containing protein
MQKYGAITREGQALTFDIFSKKVDSISADFSGRRVCRTQKLQCPMSRPDLHTSEKGFTIIEVLIALAVFAIGILAVTAMQIKAIQSNSSASGLTEATTLAQDKVENLTALDYDDASLDDTDGDDGGPGVGGGLDDKTTATADYWQNSGIYTIFWNVAVDFPIDNTKTIRVIVTWTDKNRQRRVFLDYVKANI